MIIISLDAGATDADGDPLTYAATGLPAGLSLDTSSGLISGTLSSSSAGVHNVTVTVRDGSSVDASDSFTWTVTNTNQDPTFNQDLPDRPTPRVISSASMPAPPMPTATR